MKFVDSDSENEDEYQDLRPGVVSPGPTAAAELSEEEEGPNGAKDSAVSDLEVHNLFCAVLSWKTL